MAQSRHVVVGFDDSELAHAALQAAADLAGPDGKVTVVHAYWIPPEIRYYEFFEDLEKAMAETGQTALLPAREALADAPVDVDCLALSGRPAEILCDVAVERDADEIVIGSRGHGRFALGSVAYRLLSRAPCPVLVVPTVGAVRIGGFRRILVAIDGSEDSDAAIAEAVAIAEQAGASLTFATAVPPVQEVLFGLPGYPAGYVDLKTQVEGECQRLVAEAVDSVEANLACSGQLLEGAAGAAIVEQSDSGNYDLIVMGSRGRSSVGSALLGSVSHHVSQRSSIPVLVVGGGQRSEASESPRRESRVAQ